jgi:hypothetical protein
VRPSAARDGAEVSPPLDIGGYQRFFVVVRQNPRPILGTWPRSTADYSSAALVSVHRQVGA